MDLEVREELIEGRVRRHDRNHFEVKLDYSIDHDKRLTRYRVETYLFAPRSLGIDGSNYAPEEFYADVGGYIRFKTPHVSLAALIEEDNDASPLIRLERIFRDAERGARNGDVHDTSPRELRLAACFLRAEVRERAFRLIERLEEVREGGTAQAPLAGGVAHDVTVLVDELAAYLERFRRLSSHVERPGTPGVLSELYAHVDEYQSMVSETVLTLLLDALDRAAEIHSGLDEPRKSLVRRVQDEQDMRRARGLPSVLHGLAPDEAFVYRRGLLKRLVMSVLWLDIHTEREGRRLGEVGAAAAAGAAMAFAVGAAFYAQTLWGLNTWPFFVAAVFSYMAKDRIKAWLNQTFLARMSRWLWDHSVHIRDPESGKVIGQCREAVSFMSPDDVASSVLRMRYAAEPSPLDRTRKPEVVIKYDKAIGLRGRTIATHHGRLKDISDIIRFDVSRFLVRADDPSTEERVYDPLHDAVRKVACPKVYHLNVIFVLKAGSGGDIIATQRCRVVLDQRGIRRVEEA